MSQLFPWGGHSIGVSASASSNEHPGLISFRMDWLDFLAVQGTFKSLLQHHSSKASILRCSVFFLVQLSHPYMTTGKTIALTRRILVDKVISLLFNMLSRLVINLLSRSKRLLISRLQSPSAAILEPPKIAVTVSTVYPSICHEVMGLGAMILVFNVEFPWTVCNSSPWWYFILKVGNTRQKAGQTAPGRLFCEPESPFPFPSITVKNT